MSFYTHFRVFTFLYLFYWIMSCYFVSASVCSGEIIPLYSCASSDIAVVLTENGLHPTKFNVENVTICTEHFNQFLRCNTNRSRRKQCQIPPLLSFHPETIYKPSRTMRLSDVESVHQSSGIIVPIGTPICTRCLIKLRDNAPTENLKTSVQLMSKEEKGETSCTMQDAIIATSDEPTRYLRKRKVVMQSEQEAIVNEGESSVVNYLEASINTGSQSSCSQVDDLDIEFSSQGSYAQQDSLDKMNEFLASFGLGTFSIPKYGWQTYTSRTKQKYFQGFQELVAEVAGILFGQEKDIVLKEFYKQMSNPDTVKEVNAIDDTTEALVDSYKKAESWQIKRQILSVLAVSQTYQELLINLPDITEYRYYAAKKHLLSEGCCMPPTEKEDVRQRMDPLKLDNFLEFITSSAIVKDLPYGQRKIRTSKGKVIETPNIIRCMAPQAIISQYQQYCEEHEIETLGTSTMFRILQNCTATIRKSLEGLDYYLAEGGRSFEDLIDIVKKLEENEERAKHLNDLLLGAKRYLKSDYKVHVAETSEVADHCRRHALSEQTCFSSACDHSHNSQCESCEQVKEVISDVRQLVDKTDFTHRDDKDDIIFRLRHAESGILNWKCHSLRAKNQEEAKHDIFQSLAISSSCIVLDWAMKFLPRKYREDTQDWFGKRGISWHIAVAFTKTGEVLQSLTFVHLFEGQVCQDSTVTTAVILDVVKSLQKQYPEICNIHLWSDNAGCYKSSETISSLFHFCKAVRSYDFCEAQDGKGACDRTAAVIKSSIRRYVNEGHDVMTAQQMKQAIEETKKHVQYKVKVAELDVQSRQKFAAIPNISSYNNFRFTESGIHVWKHYSIGVGKAIQGNKLDNHKPVPLKEIAAEDLAVEFHAIGNQKAKDRRPEIFTCENGGCVDSFTTASDLDEHMIIGECTINVEKEKSIDQAITKYASKLHDGDTPAYIIGCKNITCTTADTLKMGWALKEDRKCARFSNKQRDYLEEKFNLGLKSGRKEDPVTVSVEMRRVKKKDGERMFSYDELLTAQQIASFFSRMCKKKDLQSVFKETLIDRIHLEVQENFFFLCIAFSDH